MEKPTILFVDDEQNILNSLKRLFRKEPYRLITALSGEDALALLAEGETPAVVISDERMPGINGTELLRRIKELLPDCIRIILTGHSDVKAILDAINSSGLYRYLIKPWDDTDLKLSVKKGLNHYLLTEKNKELTDELLKKNTSLEKLTATLEEKVLERTHDLSKALDENVSLNNSLQTKVRELRGRDKILKHILTIHPLDETLILILEVIVDVLEANCAAIYMINYEDSSVLETSAVYPSNFSTKFGPESNYYSIASSVYKSCLSSADDIEIIDKHSNLLTIPIIIEKTCHGIIQVNTSGKQDPHDFEIPVLDHLTMHAAIAISDSQIQQDVSGWDSTIDDFLDSIR